MKIHVQFQEKQPVKRRDPNEVLPVGLMMILIYRVVKTQIFFVREQELCVLTQRVS